MLFVWPNLSLDVGGKRRGGEGREGKDFYERRTAAKGSRVHATPVAGIKDKAMLCDGGSPLT